VLARNITLLHTECMSPWGRSVFWLAAMIVAGAATLTVEGFGAYILQTQGNATAGWWLAPGAIPSAVLTFFLWWGASDLLRKRIRG
jgi:hypothetical protein